MSLVLDASAALALVYAELEPEYATLLKKALREQTVHVPQLWHLEIANVLLSGLRKGSYSSDGLKRHLADLGEVDASVDEQTPKQVWSAVLDLAAKHKLTAYDAAYLELAARLRLPLATLDRALIQAAEAERIPLFWN